MGSMGQNLVTGVSIRGSISLVDVERENTTGRLHWTLAGGNLFLCYQFVCGRDVWHW